MKADHTVARWLSEDVEDAMEALREKGIVLEQYNVPNLKTDERGIAVVGRVRTAWPDHERSNQREGGEQCVRCSNQDRHRRHGRSSGEDLRGIRSQPVRSVGPW
jgi:hypothetical protein